ncbi:MAG: cell division protein ZapB [Treponema sp.]|nr:cell division protein ZapB [Treponema sp.]
MISLEQVLLLEQKVESAVGKIQQLEAENDALRNKCSELTNALSAKSEQLKAYESDQQKIESGIIKAIDRLNSIENSVLKAAGPAAAAAKPAPAKPEPAPAPAPAPEEPAPEVTQMDFDSMDTVEEAAEEAVEEDLPPTQPDFVEEPVEDPVDEPVEEGDSESTDNLGFDIF